MNNKTQTQRTEMKPATSHTKLASPARRENDGVGASSLKRWLALPVVLGLVTFGTAVMGANVLYNGDLDIEGAAGANGQLNPGPDGWNILATNTISGLQT